MRFRAACLLSILCFAVLAHGADWPNWRGPNHDGISTEKGWRFVWPAAGPARLWNANVGTGFASVTVSDGRVFTMGNEGNTDTIFCLDAETGSEEWTFPYKEKLDPKYYDGGPGATPTVDGNRVFTLSKSGVVHCLDAATGGLNWRVDLEGVLEVKAPTWGFSGSPLIQNDLVILNVGSAGTALHKETGDVLWSSGEGPSGYSTPVPFNSNGEPSVALMGEEHLLAVRVKDGSELWRFEWETRHNVNAADPIIVDDGKFFITSGYGHGCALVSIESGAPEVIWQNKNMRSMFINPVLWNGYVYGVDDKKLVCLDVASGELQWSERGLGQAPLIIADAKLIVLSDKGELCLAETSPAAFKVISRAQVLGGKCWSMPVLADGRIYCRNASGELVCLNVTGD